ncbi:hypothetical protein, partial [Pseudomonas aeruginosa]|uniref:hypothetical protein n=1 Tax=Pseudomonas aeruginosa TaxID=287 RepID=UPI0021F17C8F
LYDQLRRPPAAAVTLTPVTQNSAHPHYGQHDQRNANLALPKRRLSGTGVMGMVHDNSLVSMAAGSV